MPATALKNAPADTMAYGLGVLGRFSMGPG